MININPLRPGIEVSCCSRLPCASLYKTRTCWSSLILFKLKMNIPRNLHINYSLKNIPVVSQFTYHKLLTSKTELVLGRMRWKLFWYRKGDRNKKKLETYGFKTPLHPPKMKELKDFEDDMADLIRKVEFRHSNNSLQRQMKRDIDIIKESPDVIVQADKTSNLYLFNKDDYKKKLLENITEEYKKADEYTLERINIEAATVAKKLELDERIEKIKKKSAYVTVKDHKEDFPGRIKFRVINPCNTNIQKNTGRQMNIHWKELI